MRAGDEMYETSALMMVMRTDLRRAPNGGADDGVKPATRRGGETQAERGEERAHVRAWRPVK